MHKTKAQSVSCTESCPQRFSSLPVATREVSSVDPPEPQPPPLPAVCWPPAPFEQGSQSPTRTSLRCLHQGPASTTRPAAPEGRGPLCAEPQLRRHQEPAATLAAQPPTEPRAAPGTEAPPNTSEDPKAPCPGGTRGAASAPGGLCEGSVRALGGLSRSRSRGGGAAPGPDTAQRAGPGRAGQRRAEPSRAPPRCPPLPPGT